MLSKSCQVSIGTPLRLVMAGGDEGLAHVNDEAHLAISLIKAGPSIMEKPMDACGRVNKFISIKLVKNNANSPGSFRMLAR